VAITAGVAGIAGDSSGAIGRHAHLSLRRIRVAAVPALVPENLAALGELLDVTSAHSVLHRDDLVVRTERTVWTAGRT
jgi:hypothetical protein